MYNDDIFLKIPKTILTRLRSYKKAVHFFDNPLLHKTLQLYLNYFGYLFGTERQKEIKRSGIKPNILIIDSGFHGLYTVY